MVAENELTKIENVKLFRIDENFLLFERFMRTISIFIFILSPFVIIVNCLELRSLEKRNKNNKDEQEHPYSNVV